MEQFTCLYLLVLKIISAYIEADTVTLESCRQEGRHVAGLLGKAQAVSSQGCEFLPSTVIRNGLFTLVVCQRLRMTKVV